MLHGVAAGVLPYMGLLFTLAGTGEREWVKLAGGCPFSEATPQGGPLPFQSTAMCLCS